MNTASDRLIMMLLSVAVDSCFMLLSVDMCYFFCNKEKVTTKYPNIWSILALSFDVSAVFLLPVS